MPRWTREPDADRRIELTITGFKIGLYKSREDAAKSHGVDPNTLRRRLNGKHKSHKVAHTHQQRLLPPAESAVVRQCIYLANAGFPARIRTIRVIATKILEEQARKLPPYQPLPPLGKAWITAFLTHQNKLRVATLEAKRKAEQHQRQF